MHALQRKAMQFWPALADQIGVSARDYTVHRLAQRNDAGHRVVVLRLNGPGGSLVLKHIAEPVDPDAFARKVSLHHAAWEAVPTGVPEILTSDITAQVVVMRHAEGVILSKVLNGESLDTQAKTLHRVGAWLTTYHRATPGQPRVFQPKYTMRTLANMVEAVQTGARRISDSQRFIAMAHSLIARQAEFENQFTQTACTHGDLHMRNVVIGQKVWGLDFASDRIVPVGHDIGRLLADYAILRAPLDQIPYGAALPRAAQTAFFSGYDLVQANDPSVQLILRHRILAEWWGLPLHGKTAAQHRRWIGISALADRVFHKGR